MRFFFDFDSNGQMQFDTEGIEVASPEHARSEAFRAIHSVAMDEAQLSNPTYAISSVVRDEDDHVLFTATLTYRVTVDLMQ